MWKLRIATASVIFIVCFFVARSGVVVFGQRITISPYTVEMSERYLDPHTRQARTEIRLIGALRSDGSKASLRVYDGEVMSRRVVDVRHRRSVILSDTERTKSTNYFSEQEQQAILTDASSPDCSPNPRERPVREESILGFRAFVFERTDSVAGQNYRVTRWAVPDLNCTDIQSILESRDGTGHITGMTGKSPIFIRMGEPDASLFQVSEEYAEMSPSAMQENSYLRRHKTSPPPNLKVGWNAQDQRYHASQRHKP